MSTVTQPRLLEASGEHIPSLGLRASDGFLLNLRSFVSKQPAIFVFFGAPSLSGAAREQGDALATTLRDGFERAKTAGVALVGITCDN
jgi:peroxiredoxin